MKVTEEYPSNFLEAATIAPAGPDGVEVVIESLKKEGVKSERGTSRCNILYFKGKQKGMVLNKTNAKRIRDNYGYGDVMEEWVGKSIRIYATTCDAFGKKSVPCIRVMIPEPEI